ncbi:MULTISPECIES: hypothetical protein [unclassified Fibrobacter]|uniref:hypothetical protein n=1 Tax=unclassified Fibrobacter TaxID=2634177 RepID=UPI000D7A9273|nr:MULTISPECIES: hypothetical protein [unclassified Fibrobacter]PWJ71985.1 hypothetical protein BGX12_101224 [Fibrobacter sp. UWR4]PZW62326.1 hypothetical protein C8E88_10646 [Fibrobacter sp. UWR1]
MRYIISASRSASRAIFPVAMALTPAVFAGMFFLSGSALAATAVAVAYASVILGEKIG